jgi:hypothetical protein
MSVAPPSVLTGHHPQRGLLWAAVDSNVRFLKGEIADRRFGAYLSPFSDEADAIAALKAAGAQHVEAERGQRKRRG